VGTLGTPASSTTKTGRHDITEILLKVALNTKNQSQIIYILVIAKTSTFSKSLYFQLKPFIYV
jgi:hypothetical protein